MRGMVPLLLLVPTLAAAATVRVRVAALGETESCRSDRALATQLRSISGLAVAEREFDFEATLEREGVNWQISLRKPDGTLALRRSLAGARECADVSFAAALIIERFARALDLRVELPGARQASAVGETKAADAKAASTKASETKAAETKAAETKAAETKAAETKAAETKAAETKAAETKAAETKAAETKAAETKAAEAKAAEAKAAETRAAEAKAAETRAAETRAAKVKAAESPPSQPSAADAKLALAAATTSATEPAPAATARAEVSSSGPSRLRLTRWEISASGAGWLSTTSSLRPGFEASAAIFIAQSWRLAAQFALTTAETTSVRDENGDERGTLTTQPFLAALGLGYCRDELTSAHLRTCGGVVAGAHLETGATRGDYLFYSENRWLVRPAFGLEAQLGWLPIRSLVIGLAVAGLVLPVAAAWEIKDLPVANRPLPLFEGLVRLSVSFGADR